MSIARDFVLSPNGDIRYVGKGAKYTVVELHRLLSDLNDQAPAPGRVLDYTCETASMRSTDQIITLQGHWNIDDHAAEHLKDGTITQSNGDRYTSGVEIKSKYPSLRRA